MPELVAHRTVDAPAGVVWDVITDHELYGEVAPNLASVEVLEGSGGDLVRRCVDTDGNAWTEACTHWDEGQSFGVSVDVGSSDFHRRLFSRFEGEWSIAESPDGVTITIRFSYEPRYGPVGRLISWYLRARAPPVLETLFDNWEAAIAARLDHGASGDVVAPGDRLGGNDVR